MAWTFKSLGGATTLFSFNPDPEQVSEKWTRSLMNIDMPYSEDNLISDWVSTGKVITITGKLVAGNLDETSTARDLPWWKIHMQDLMPSETPGVVVELNDGNPGSISGLYSWGNSRNKYGIIEDIEWQQTGGEQCVQSYRITFIAVKNSMSIM
jgi:hypothetical protein